MNQIEFDWSSRSRQYVWVDEDGKEYRADNISFILIRVVNAIIKLLNKKLDPNPPI